MKEVIWTQKYTVNTFLVNPQKKLGLYGLLNLVQDTAWVHATHLGHGYEKMLEEKTAWVLTRQKLRMKEWPHWGDEVALRTWIRPIQSIVATRDFEILKDERVIGECTTQWLIMDLETRKPSDKNLRSDEVEVRHDGVLTFNAGKINLQKELKDIGHFNVRNSDLDLNGHVNNTKYAQWILDSISEEKHREYLLHEYEINFIAETKAGDVITILCNEQTAEFFHFQGLRKNDNKIVFAATMKVKSQQLSPPYNPF